MIKKLLKSKAVKRQFILWLPILLGLVLIGVFLAIRLTKATEKGEETIITTSTLMNVIDISELSTAKFTYNGIAPIYKDSNSKKVKCYVRYYSEVKAGIDMKGVKFEIDHDAKRVKPILPNISITSNIVNEKELSFIPKNAQVELNEVLNACKKDSEKEAKKSGELIEIAEENLRTRIEALLCPVLKAQNYELVWD